MEGINGLCSEDDVRTKLVYPWLEEHGFLPGEVSVEFSIDIRGGRSKLRLEGGKLSKDPRPTSGPGRTQTFRPRADVLVRRHDGKNLMIIEVKAPGEPLDDEARDQGCLYARALLHGNIAPVVVLTNGAETKVFDSITKEEITEEAVTRDSVYTRAEFRADGGDLALRSEALERLISLSAQNLSAFCDVQSSFRMDLLRSHELNAGRKYVPELYVERREARKKLLELIDVQECPVAVLVGPPQVGKTNLVCRMVEKRLAKGEPTLFYPAVSVRRSLLQEIAEDFESAFGQVSSPVQLLDRIRRVLRSAGKRLVIFIDGWNEADLQLARIIDEESQRLSSPEIQIVISLTVTSAARLLIGNAGNPSFIARAAEINSQSAQLLAVEQKDIKKLDWSVVVLSNYTAEERDRAYRKYASAYNVTVPTTHRKTAEPYILGLAMNIYQGGTLPERLDEPELIEKYIREKISRAVGLEDYEAPALLGAVAKEMFRNDAPVRKETAAALCGLPPAKKLPAGLFDAGLLTERTGPGGDEGVDFYYGRDRDFVISYWSQRWRSKAEGGIDITEEFEQASRTLAGTEAVGWFLRQPRHVGLLSKLGVPPHFEAPVIRRIFISSLCDIVSRGLESGEGWLKYAIDCSTKDPDMMVRIESAKLISLLSEEADDLVGALEGANIYDVTAGLLSVADEFSLKEDAVGYVVMEALGRLHSELIGDGFDGSDVTWALDLLMDHDSRSVRAAAATCLGHAAPVPYLRSIAERLESGELDAGSPEAEDYSDGLGNAISGLSEAFYGSYCPGYFEVLKDDPELQREEYERLAEVAESVIEFYARHPRIRELKDLLDQLSEGIEDEPEVEEDDGAGSKPSLDELTLPLPFEDPEES